MFTTGGPPVPFHLYNWFKNKNRLDSQVSQRYNELVEATPNVFKLIIHNRPIIKKITRVFKNTTTVRWFTASDISAWPRTLRARSAAGPAAPSTGPAGAPCSTAESQPPGTGTAGRDSSPACSPARSPGDTSSSCSRTRRGTAGPGRRGRQSHLPLRLSGPRSRPRSLFPKNTSLPASKSVRHKISTVFN